MENKMISVAFCEGCHTVFLQLREIDLQCPNCGEAVLVDANYDAARNSILIGDLVVPLYSEFITLRECLDLDRGWGKLRQQICAAWSHHISSRYCYLGGIKDKQDYFRYTKRAALAASTNFSLLSKLSNYALKLAIGIVWVKEEHPWGRYSCKCEREHKVPVRVDHRCRRDIKKAGSLCGTCLLPVNQRGCWLCRTCGGVLLWNQDDLRIKVPYLTRHRVLHSGKSQQFSL